VATSLNTPRAKNLALLLLAMTQFVVVIDASIVNVALPSIGRALRVSSADLSWVVNAYTRFGRGPSTEPKVIVMCRTVTRRRLVRARPGG
jgi:predicted MFS family arabinose efflux permease